MKVLSFPRHFLQEQVSQFLAPFVNGIAHVVVIHKFSKGRYFVVQPISPTYILHRICETCPESREEHHACADLPFAEMSPASSRQCIPLPAASVNKIYTMRKKKSSTRTSRHTPETLPLQPVFPSLSPLLSPLTLHRVQLRLPLVLQIADAYAAQRRKVRRAAEFVS